MAVIVSRLVVNVPPIGDQARPWAGAFLLIGFAALLLAAAVGLDGWSGELSGRSFSWIQPAAVLAGVAVAPSPWAARSGGSGPVPRVRWTATAGRAARRT